VKRCASCKSLMPADAPKCIKCGFASVTPSMPPPSPAPAPSPAAAARPAVAPLPSFAPGERPGRIRGAWLLAKQSWRVLMLDKELLVFPLLSGIACLLVLATFAAGVIAAGHFQGEKGDTTTWVLAFIYYFVNYFVIVFFNSALVACAMIRFRGGNPTVADGLRAAGARLPQILAWALLASTVGIVLRMIQERLEFIGRIVIGLIGAAWTIATYFIVPVLVEEKLGPLDAVKRSTELMQQTWGESLASHVGIGAATGLISFLGVLLIGIASVALAVATSNMGVMIAGGVAVVAFLVLAALVSSALSTIVLSALYLYAAEKKAPQAFDGVAQFAFAPLEKS
jgi:Family of unknown function (DUF6159)